MYPNLRVQLWKTGLRQNKLARMLNMDESLLSRIVNGYRAPSQEVRRKISAILKSDEIWLFEVETSADQNTHARATSADK